MLGLGDIEKGNRGCEARHMLRMLFDPVSDAIGVLRDQTRDWFRVQHIRAVLQVDTASEVGQRYNCDK